MLKTALRYLEYGGGVKRPGAVGWKWKMMVKLEALRENSKAVITEDWEVRIRLTFFFNSLHCSFFFYLL